MDRIEEIDNLVAELEKEKELLEQQNLLDKYSIYNSYLNKFVRKIDETGSLVFKPNFILFEEECFEGTTITEIGLKFNWIYFEGIGECKFEILTEEEIKQVKIETVNRAIKDLNEFFQ